MRTRQAARRNARRVAAVLVAALVAGACSSSTQKATPAGSTIPPTTATGVSTANSAPGSTTPQATGTPPSFEGLRLSAGHAAATASQPATVVAGTPLDNATVAGVEARLPQWTPGTSQTKPFNWPVQSKPAPTAGKTVDTPFPATTDQAPPPAVDNGPLHVVRHQPDGAVTIAPFMTITFDQPMAPITTIGQLAATDVPATISPAVPGRWQWIGTSTLRFDATSPAFDRLPMATEFTVTVPAGTKSATGGVLADAVSFQFSTPSVTVQSFEPTGRDLSRTPVFVAVFDQNVDPQAVLATTTLRAGATAVPTRMATDEEVQADDGARQIVANVPKGRWMAIRPLNPLPADTDVSVEIGPNAPSAEGPKLTTSPASYSGHTYEPLRIVRADCSYGANCAPGTAIELTFNNELAAKAFDPASVRVDPPLAGASISAVGNTITISGATLAKTTYRVTVAATLTDTHGQHLGAEATKSVDIGSASPVLQQFAMPLTTLDPLVSKAALSVFTTNHHDFHLLVYKVEPKDWTAYTLFFTAMMQANGVAPAAPWQPAIDTIVPVAAGDDRSVETAVDLSSVLKGAHGHAVVIVEPTEKYPQNSNDYWSNRATITWVQATSIGVDAFNDSTSLRVWTTDLGSGAPLPGVSIAPTGSDGKSVTTDADGLVSIDLTDQQTNGIIASRGDDSAILSPGYYGSGWQSQPTKDDARWFVFDDRQTYRPGETVTMKGWIRRLTAIPEAQLKLFASGTSVSFTANDGQGNPIGSGTADVDPLGGFDLMVAIPADANLGASSVQLQINGAGELQNSSFTHVIQIQEFRRPDFEVAAHAAASDPAIQGSPLTVVADATYYAGGPLGNATVQWQVSSGAAHYSPPNRDTFTFGVWTPWWLDGGYGGYGGPNGAAGRSDTVLDAPCCGPQGPQPKISTFDGTTDAGGSDYLQVDVGKLDDTLQGLPVTVTAEATVTDVNRQAIAGHTSILVHPSTFYVGLRSDRTFVRKGDSLTVQTIVTAVDGTAAAGRKVAVTASRIDSRFQDGKWIETPADVQHCDVVSTGSAVDCTFKPSDGGTYTITATVADDQGRSSRSELTRWVSGAESSPSRSVDQQGLTIVPDKVDYEPGDSAQVFVQSPFPGSGLITVSRGGIVRTIRFEAADGSAIVPVPIVESDVPNLDLTIEVVGVTPRTGGDGTSLPDSPPRPAFAAGTITLDVSTKSRTLTVAATPRSTSVAPGSTTQVDVTVADAAGSPVSGAQFAIVVVDEAVLALSDYSIGDPLATFYDHIPSYVSTQFGRQSIFLTDPASAADENKTASASTTAGTTAAAAPSRADSAGAGAAVPASAALGTAQAGGGPVAVRTNFDALAVFRPSVATDGSGKATVDVPLPDSLTRYRVMVVAVSGADHFGSAEATITARLALMVRPSAPRFLNFGDVAQLPVVLQNQTDAAMPVDVVLQTDNLTLTGAPGQHVVVPANDRVEVRFAVSSAQAGTATFRVAAVSGDAADSATIELPVYTPATTESFATYGTVDGGATVQPVKAPTNVFPQFGGLSVTTSSTSLQALTDAVLYVAKYPYETSDAMASRILTISSLKDVLAAFDAPGLPSPAELNTTIDSDVSGLAALQNDDGGFAYWQRGEESDPFNSVQAVHALTIAKAAGHSIPAGVMGRALGFLSSIEEHFPLTYGQAQRDSVSAYALDVRMLAGDRDPAKAEAFFAGRGEELPLDAIAWLWPVIQNTKTSAAIERIIQNRAVDTAGSVTFTTAADDKAYLTLQSDRRTDGLILDALIRVRPKSDLIPKAVAGLLAAQTQGRWDNIQENSFILLAMKRYFDTYESQTPDFVADVWLGDRLAGEQTFKGRSTDRDRLTIPTADLQAAGDAPVTISKTGAGRLYYRIGLQTAPSNLQLQPLDRGFVVTRSYEAVDAASDVSRDSDGTWHVKAGARVRVRLTMVAESQRTHVALIDALPAGMEILNPALATTATLPTETGQAGDTPTTNPGGAVPSASPAVSPDVRFWSPTWFDHQNMRDDRAEAFANVLPAGVFDYSYVASATTPGSFVVPPTRAEEMYAPETFGRAGTDRVVIEG